MKRIDAIRAIVPLLPAGALVVAGTGRVGRMLFAEGDADGRFYLLGASGLASAVGLGVAMQKRDRAVIVLDGDASVLMSLGALANVAEQEPENLYHVVIDNGVYGSTAGPRTISDDVAIEEVAWACGYNRAERVEDERALEVAMGALFEEPGPAMVLVAVDPEDAPGDVPPISLAPADLAARFRAAASAAPASTAT